VVDSTNYRRKKYSWCKKFWMTNLKGIHSKFRDGSKKKKMNRNHTLEGQGNMKDIYSTLDS